MTPFLTFSISHMLQAAKSALAAAASELADATPRLATCSASTTLVNTGRKLITH